MDKTTFFLVLIFFLLNSCTQISGKLGLFTDIRNGKEYKTIKIGEQVWMSENLSVLTFLNGDSIPEAKTDEEWSTADQIGKPACCIFINDSANDSIYGRLYNWYAVNDPRGLAPQGWHIPSIIEWNMLTDLLGGGERLVGTKMKNAKGWEPYNGNNKSGFSGLPGGIRGSSGKSTYLGVVGSWWSSNEYDKNGAWYRGLDFQLGLINKYYFGKGFGLSVRCIKD